MVPRVALLVGLVLVSVLLQGCEKGEYKKEATHVYSNSKYLADISEDMSFEKCERYCNTWATVCEDDCKRSQRCGLSEDVNAMHFTRDESCKKQCVGFNMRKDG